MKDKYKDRRRYLRGGLYCLFKFKFKETDVRGTLLTSSINISAGGMLARSRKPLKPNDVIEITLNFLNEADEFFNIEGRIVWVEKAKTYWRVGIEFIEIDEDKRMLIDSYIKSLYKTE